MENNDIERRQKIINYGYKDIAISIPLVGGAALCFVIVAIGILRGTANIKTALILMILGVMIGFPGFRLVGKGCKGIRLRKNVRLYGDMISDQGKRSIENIASDLGRRDTERVMDEIQELIDLEFLLGVTLNRSRRILTDMTDAGELSKSIFRFPSWNSCEDERTFLNRAGRVLLRVLVTQDLWGIRLLFGEPDEPLDEDSLAADQAEGVGSENSSVLLWTTRSESNLKVFFPQLLFLMVVIENGKLTRAGLSVQGGKLTCEMSLRDGPEQQFKFIAA